MRHFTHVCVHTHMHTHAHAHIHTNTHAHACTYTRTHKHMCTCTHIYTRVRAHTHVSTHTHMNCSPLYLKADENSDLYLPVLAPPQKQLSHTCPHRVMQPIGESMACPTKPCYNFPAPLFFLRASQALCKGQSLCSAEPVRLSSSKHFLQPDNQGSA